jgi:enamine deaminase RidA (YjgF/YER057c/UK114 family)
VQLAESEFDAGAVHESGKTPLQQASESAYREIFKLADALDFTHILRFWNYIADINGQSHGIERYRQFNMGRQDGFLSAGRDVKGSVPAASAVGFADGPLTIYFLAGRNVTPIAIENPRQVSAYQYPKDYGQRSPTFSRASVVQLGGNDVFFLSGTASIVGHRTLHVGDVVAQTRETLANITAIIAEANRVAPRAGFALGDLCYKVYVRHEQDVNAIHNELRRSLGQSARMMFLKADICRQDLLMEIEASAGHPLEC